MAEKIQFSSWTFEPDMREAWHRETGEAVRFTRAERALLNAFIESSGHVLQRDLLLDAVAGLDADVADRSIDFIIHRLRRKLKDEPRNPRYIATQYGEGYVWVAEPTSAEQPSSGAFLVVGPVHGLGFAPQLADRGRLFARVLAREIDRGTAAHNAVVFDSHCPSPENFKGQPSQLALTLDFLETDTERLDCVLALRRFTTDTLIRIERVTVCDHASGASVERRVATRLARTLIDDIWYALQPGDIRQGAPDIAPLPIGLHEASESLFNAPHTWADAEQRLRRVLRNNPDDHQSRLLLASALHSRYVLSDPEQPTSRRQRDADEIEIEGLVTAALPHLQDNDLYALTAAKLLYFVNKAHRQFALGLAERTFESTTAFASTFAILAQLYMWEGAIDKALTLYDRGYELAHHGSHFHLYILVLKAGAEMAAGYPASPAADELYTVKPLTRAQLGLFYAPTDAVNVRPDITAVLDRLDAAGARATIRHLHYLAARHFREPTHRQNILRRPVRLLLERFDARIVPDDVRADAPADLLG